MTRLFGHIKTRLPAIMVILGSNAFMLIIMRLTDRDMSGAFYALYISLFLLICWLTIDYIYYQNKLKRLSLLLNAHSFDALCELPSPFGAAEAAYQAILASLRELYMKEKNAHNAAIKDAEEYYALWVHQIKTPIFALRLLLNQAPPSKEALQMQRELFKIEDYTLMALKYIRLMDISQDLSFEQAELYEVCAAAAKKYSILFIAKRLTLNIAPFSFSVSTDKKWLLTVLEQLFSNAVKYTSSGGVSVCFEGRTLYIRDSGIGIRAADIPRIFEKGFTGLNGRIDERASGIGLYIAKKAADALDIRLGIASVLGEGTTASVTFPEKTQYLE